mmetsp:Transcript_19657/g.55889  ORF Transcript_19657/g.55889 Transcript_19657/m.55889 type:complete len:211 (-) Transcript_19657:115-747(-)
MWRIVAVMGAFASASASAQADVQHEKITVFQNISIFNTAIWVEDDEFNDFGWYETVEDCMAGVTAVAEPEDAWRFKGEIDVCASNETRCYPGAIVSNNLTYAIEFAATSASLEMKLYKGDACGGSILKPNLADASFAGEERKDFLSGRCDRATILGKQFYGHLEIRKVCRTSSEPNASDADIKDAAAGRRPALAAALGATALALVREPRG